MTPAAAHLRRAWTDFAAAMQFLTRIPRPSLSYEADSLARSTKFFRRVAAVLLRNQATAAILSVILVTWLTGIYYKRRIGGITGDCFRCHAIQLAEIRIYLCGAWTL